MPLSSDLLHDLQRAGLETRTDHATRMLYSTDASLYQIEPLGVAFPRSLDDLCAAVGLAAGYQVPVLARGAGSSLAGQAIGEALILDCSRYLDKIYAIHIGREGEGSYAVVESGVILSHLNRAAAPHGLQFGPDPASADRATLGGSLANNATGAHSIVYGMFADHLLSVEVALADGSVIIFEETTLETARRFAISGEQKANGDPRAGVVGHSTLISNLYRTALQIRETHAETIQRSWPQTWRRASGYNLNYLLPWSPSPPSQWHSASPYPPVTPNHINLAPLIAGSEGTLAIVRRATVRLVPKPRHTILAVLTYGSVVAACEAVPDLLMHNPSAVELIPQYLIRLARSVPAYASQLSFVQGDPAALLVVEFSGNDPARLREQARSLRAGALIAETSEVQKQVWSVRKVGLGIMQSQPGDRRTHTFIEDLSVPVERLGEFVRGMDQIMAEHGTQAYFYAHASAGCLHIRPLLDLKTAQGVADLRSIAQAAVDLVIDLGGATSGEHGDGLARSEWLEQLYSPEIVDAFRRLKGAADPEGILNPGKIVDPLPMDRNLRYGADYQTQTWQPTLNFDRQGGLAGAIELCNGAGVCRKLDGVMCPSFQVTREEMYSTRGRANLLRSLISNQAISMQTPGGGEAISPTDNEIASMATPSSLDMSEDVFDALDLCLACKGCKAECPSTVDIAKLKYEFTHHYYQTHRRKLRDYLFGYFGVFAHLGAPFGRLINWGMGNGTLWGILSRTLKLAPERQPPRFQVSGPRDQESQLPNHLAPNTCLLLMDPFTQHFHPEAGEATIHVLESAGYRVQILPTRGAGRTLISKGFLDAAKKHACKLVDAIVQLDPEGKLPIIGIEPSEIYTLSDEYPDFFPGDERVMAIAQRAWMIDEFLVRPGTDAKPRMDKLQPSVLRPPSSILLHGHCYQKARPPADDSYPSGVAATVAMLKTAGYPVEVIDSGCCGMAGAFGYEAEHYELSMQIGEQALFPAVREAGEGVIVAAAGVSCQAQIEDGTQRRAIHPIMLIKDVI